MPCALVTGATSYIGIVVVRQLLAAGWQVHVLARETSDLSRLPGGLPEENIRRLDGGQDQLNAAVADAAPDVTFHFASLYIREPNSGQLADLLEANFSFGVQLLEALRLAGRPVHFVNAGTGIQYFQSTTPRPLNLYAATKQAFAEMLDYYVEAEGFAAVSLILFDTYGPQDWRVKLLNAMYDAGANGTELSLPDDDAELDLLYIDDAAAAFVHVGDRLLSSASDLVDGPYALSSGQRQKISDIVEVWLKISDRPLNVKWGAYDLPERRTEKLWHGPALPGWTPQLTFEQGLKKFLDERN